MFFIPYFLPALELYLAWIYNTILDIGVSMCPASLHNVTVWQSYEASVWDLGAIWEGVTWGDARVLISTDTLPAFITLMPRQFMENPGLLSLFTL